MKMHILSHASANVLSAYRAGKSTLQAQVLAECRKQGENALVVDRDWLSVQQHRRNERLRQQRDELIMIPNGVYGKIGGFTPVFVDECVVIEEASFKKSAEKLHPYQERALDEFIANAPAIVKLPVGAAKTLCTKRPLDSYSDSYDSAKPTMKKLLDSDERIVAFQDNGKDGFFIYTRSSEWVCNGTQSGTFRGDNMTSAIKWYKSQVTKWEGV